MPEKPLIQIQADEAETFLKGSSWLRYNGILLTDVLTESYEMQEVRSPDGSQLLSIHHIAKVIGIIDPAVNTFTSLTSGDPYTGQTTTYTRAPLAADQVGSNVILLNQGLLQERRGLDWNIGGTTVLRSPLPGFPCDSQQGPKPLYANVTSINGTSSYFIRFGIETWIDSCVDSSPHYIHSHRYSMVHDVDGDTWLTTRVVTGHVKFRPEFLEKYAFEPDQIERKYFHPVPPGFKRHNIRVQALPNGMEVAYSFTDSEVSLPLGSKSPATKLSAEFSIASSLAEGKPAVTQAAVHISASGPKSEYRSNLLIMALRIALRKIQKPGHLMTTDIVVTYSLDNTFVDLTIKALWKSVGIGPEGLQLATTGLGALDDYDDLDKALINYREVDEPVQGTQNDLALSRKLRDNDSMGTYAGYVIGSSLVNGCFLVTRPINGIWEGKGNGKSLEDRTTHSDIDGGMVDQFGNAIAFSLEEVPVFTIQNAATGLSSDSTNGAGWFVEWQSDVRYHTNHQIAMMPIGATQNPSPGDAVTYVPPQFATLGYPFTLKSVSWTILWIGPNPLSIILPSPDTGDPNDVLLAEDVTPAVPAICNSSNKAWRVSGTYWYGQKKLRTSSLTAKAAFDYTDQGFAMGKSITDPSAQTANTIGLSRFIAGYSPSFV